MQIDRQIEGYVEREMENMQKDRYIESYLYIDRQKGIQIDKEIEIYIDRYTDEYFAQGIKLTDNVQNYIKCFHR